MSEILKSGDSRILVSVVPIPTGSDGAGWINVYVDEAVPDEIARFAASRLVEMDRVVAEYRLKREPPTSIVELSRLKRRKKL